MSKDRTRNYECVVVFNPEVSEEVLAAEIAKVQKLIADKGGQSVRSDIWGKRELAYVAHKYSKATYVAFYFECSKSETVSDVTQILRITDNVLKFQTHLIEEKVRKAGKVRMTPEYLEKFNERASQYSESDDWNDSRGSSW